jgi:hypothetical protein
MGTGLEMRGFHATCVTITHARTWNFLPRAQIAIGTFNAQTNNRMRIRKAFLRILTLFAAFRAYGQGTTFVYDQQSSTDEGYYGYGTGPAYQGLLPVTGQSFTPSLSGIDFIRLELNDSSPTGALGSTWFLNLHSDSIHGPILATTAPVDLPGAFTGTANFFFPNTIPLTPGATYWFDVNSPDGGAWHLVAGILNYPGGYAWAQDTPHDFSDYWFREGLVVPEPSSAALLLLGGAAFISLRRPKRQ